MLGPLRQRMPLAAIDRWLAAHDPRRSVWYRGPEAHRPTGPDDRTQALLLAPIDRPLVLDLTRQIEGAGEVVVVGVDVGAPRFAHWEARSRGLPVLDRADVGTLFFAAGWRGIAIEDIGAARSVIGFALRARRPG